MILRLYEYEHVLILNGIKVLKMSAYFKLCSPMKVRIFS